MSTVAADALAKTGISYRQLDYWTTTGRIRANEANPGRGTPRTWPDDELHVAALMGRLLNAGFTLDGAANAARSLLRGPAAIAPDVWVEVNLPWPPS